MSKAQPFPFAPKAAAGFVAAAPRLRTYNEKKLTEIQQLNALPPEGAQGVARAARLFPFKVNDYSLSLVDWRSAPDDPMFRLLFPQAEMLDEAALAALARLEAEGASSEEVERAIVRIRRRLNPHSSSQEANVPIFEGAPLAGVQHKYEQTVLFFPKQAQTCHSYCSFCFRWPQFVESGAAKFELEDPATLHAYLRAHPEVTDLLMTGGDPMILSARRMRAYLEPLLEPAYAHVTTLRIGTKALTYWPFRFLTDPDAADLLDLFKRLVDRGKHLAVMIHVNHWREMEPEPFQEAAQRLIQAGAALRSQSPVLRHINDDPLCWRRMWARQVEIGVQPYYMFVERDTGASHYFGLPLSRALRIYQEACSGLSGLARAARGPIMSAGPGKVHLLGCVDFKGEKHFLLSFLQARRREWLYRPFFARHSETAQWFDDLDPPSGEESFFFAEDYARLLTRRDVERDASALEAAYA